MDIPVANSVAWRDLLRFAATARIELPPDLVPEEALANVPEEHVPDGEPDSDMGSFARTLVRGIERAHVHVNDDDALVIVLDKPVGETTQLVIDLNSAAYALAIKNFDKVTTQIARIYTTVEKLANLPKGTVSKLKSKRDHRYVMAAATLILA